MMAPMGTARRDFAATLQDTYIYVFGGCYNDRSLSSAKRFSIHNSTWEDLPDTPKGPRDYHCAVILLAVMILGPWMYLIGLHHRFCGKIKHIYTICQWKDVVHQLLC
mmetsp:Transcript_3770/g.5783  ORF Transcript_3770/g.5783 Transcript_3770/m.5783 type:complete len:107 (+) Transcript_3770:172-492(+)